MEKNTFITRRKWYGDIKLQLKNLKSALQNTRWYRTFNRGARKGKNKNFVINVPISDIRRVISGFRKNTHSSIISFTHQRPVILQAPS